MIAAAATITVVYPHMNGVGGDSFWLVLPPGGAPIAIDACGPAAQAATIDAYRQRGLAAIPLRGALAANTVAGTIGGWQCALELAGEMGGTLPLARLVEDAIGYACDGLAVTQSQQKATASNISELRNVSSFSAQFLIDNVLPQAGQRFVQSRLAATLSTLVTDGLDSYYCGPLAECIAADLASVGSLVDGRDLAAYRAHRVTALHLLHSTGDQTRIFTARPFHYRLAPHDHRAAGFAGRWPPGYARRRYSA